MPVGAGRFSAERRPRGRGGASRNRQRRLLTHGPLRVAEHVKTYSATGIDWSSSSLPRLVTPVVERSSPSSDTYPRPAVSSDTVRYCHEQACLGLRQDQRSAEPA
jgi:hypothetical protein